MSKQPVRMLLSCILLFSIHTMYTESDDFQDNEIKYNNPKIVEASLLFHRLLKKWMFGIPKMPFLFRNKKYSLETLKSYEESLTIITKKELREYSNLLSDVKQKFIRKVIPFVELSREFAKTLYPRIEKYCIQKNKDNSFLMQWIRSEREISQQLFLKYVQSFSDLYVLCIDLESVLYDIVNNNPEALHQFEMRMKKIKKFKTLILEKLENLTEEEQIILNKKSLVAHFKEHETHLFSLEEITNNQIELIISRAINNYYEQSTI